MVTKKELKDAKALLDSGDSAACAAECKKLLSALEGDENESQDQLVALSMMLGSASLQLRNWETGEEAFRRACSLRPDAPQSWKGMLDCLEGAGKLEKMPEPLLRLASIAKGKGNWSRCRSLTLRAVTLAMDHELHETAAYCALKDYLGAPEAQNCEDADQEAVDERNEMLARLALLHPLDEVPVEVAQAALCALKSPPSEPSLVGRLLDRLCQCPVESLAPAPPSEVEVGDAAASVILGELRKVSSEAARRSTCREDLVRRLWDLKDRKKSEIESCLPEWLSEDLLPSKTSSYLAQEAALWKAWKSLLAGNEAEASQHFASSRPAFTAEDWRVLGIEALLTGTNSPSVALAALELHPTRPKTARSALRDLLIMRQASLEAKAGNATGAMALLDAEIVSAVQAEDSERKSSMLCCKGTIARLEGKVEQALELYRAAMEVSEKTSALAAEEAGWLLLINMGDPEAARPLLEKALGLEPNSRRCYRLAYAYWEIGGSLKEDRSGCFALLLRAAQMNPSAASGADTFNLLGHWYADVARDSNRAEGCYARAVKLDASHRQSGEALVRIFVARGEKDKAMALLHASAASSTEAYWAWAGLSRGRLVQWTNCSSASANGDNDHLLSEAADFMLQAIRCASRMTAWEYWAELGWIYQRQSKLAASLKAYCLAMDMLEECKVQREGSGDDLVLAEATIRTDLALVYRGMGLVDDAMKHLTAALELGTDRMDDAQHAMILLGSAQARLAQCHARSCEGLYSAAAAALMAGINIADQLVTVLQCSLPLQHRLDVTDVVWKLLGDLKLYASRLPPSCFGGFSGVQKLLAEAAQAYSKAREAIDGRGGGVSAQATAEYDIGLAHLQHAWSLQLEMGDGSGLWLSEQYVQLPEILRLRSLASRHFKASINLEPTSSAAWVGLGCSSPHPLAQQHCFVRSTQIDRNHSGLVNLASMYCRYSKNDEAYETLNVLQSAVDHPLMWVMLGLLKEAEGTSGTCKQACDAFYSSLEAAHPLDGLMGLGRTTPLVHSLQDGIVALELYCDINPANALAWTVLGLLFEASERPAKASRCYLDAWKLLERQEGVMGTTAETVQARSIIMENLCRASSVAKSCLPSFELPDLFDSVKLATHSQALLSASKGAWKDALVCIADQEHLVGSVLHVLVSFWGGDTSGAMQLGAQRMTTQASMCVFDGGKGLDGLPIYGGIRNIRQEHKSTAVATRELQAQASALAACRTSTSTQRRLLCRALHLRPESPSLWAQLASACLREEWGSAVAAGLAKSCASAATNLVRCYHADTSQRGWAMFRGIDGAIGMEGDEGVIAPAPTAEVEALSFSTQALSGMVNAASSRKTIRLLLKALHTDPSNLASWHLLASALVGHVIEEDRGDNESLALATASSIFVMLSLPAPSAHCILLQGNLHEAREAASYITSGPQKALHEARSFASERNWDAAVARYKEAGLQDPSQWHHEIVQELSNCLEMQGEVVVAAAFLRTAAALQAGHAEKNQSSSAAAAAASLLLKLSSLLHRHGRLNDAMSTLNEASALLRRNSEAQATISFLRGAIWAAGSNSKKKAMDALDRAKDSSVPPELLAAYSATLQ